MFKRFDNEKILANIVQDTGIFSVKSIVDVLNRYDKYTCEHSLGVATLSVAIGRYLDMPEKDLERLGICAIAHDFGKSMLPVQLINKPGKLTDEEYLIVKKHSRLGYEFFIDMSVEDSTILSGIVQHHEFWDGSGYPMGLKAHYISLFGRIICIADVFDALMSNRSYREALPILTALEIMDEGVGTKFDKEILNVFFGKELYFHRNYHWAQVYGLI